MATSDLKIKNENPNGQSIKVQAWDGKVPTYDSEAQRAKALATSAFDVDSPPAPIEPAAEGEKLPEGYDKFKKPELIELAQARLAAGKEIHLDEADTVKVLREKIEATYPVVEGDEPAAEGDAVAEPTELRYDFSKGNLLQEKTLGVGEEKVFSVSSGTFITIQIDE